MGKGGGKKAYNAPSFGTALGKTFIPDPRLMISKCQETKGEQHNYVILLLGIIKKSCTIGVVCCYSTMSGRTACLENGSIHKAESINLEKGHIGKMSDLSVCHQAPQDLMVLDPHLVQANTIGFSAGVNWHTCIEGRDVLVCSSLELDH